MSVTGYHVFNSNGSGHVATLCDGCASGIPSVLAFDYEDTEKCYSDSPEHCEQCDALLDHSLTPDGYWYVAQELLDSLYQPNPTISSVEWEWYIEWGGILTEDGYLSHEDASMIEDLPIVDRG